MRFSVLFSLIALIAIVNCQDSEVKFVIDAFTAITPAIISIIPTGGIPDPQSAFVRDGTIMGGERDLQLTVGSGDSNLILTTGVSGGSYTAATPNEARGNSLYQLDGIDGTMNLDASGLFGTPNNNFMANSANAFRIVHETDLPGRIFFRIYSGSVSNVCTYTLITIGDDTTHVEIIPFSDFSGSCDFSNVGAVEIFIAMDDNIDVLISEFSTWGPEETCVCNCPAFTCNGIVQDVNGGDFEYYFTSDFRRSGTFNPTTDLSSINFTVSQFTSLFTTDISSIFTSNLFSSITSNINTSFSVSLFDDDDSSNTSDDDDSSNNSDDDDSSNNSDDDDSSNNSDDDDSSNNSGSSSSSNDASVMTVATVAVLVLAVLF